MSPASNDPPPREGLSRRGFLVTFGGAVLGSYFLPQLDLGADSAAVAEPAAEAVEVVRRLITKPTWKKAKRGGAFLFWTEDTDKGVQPMVWAPYTPEEAAEAQRFYEDARKFRAPRAKAPAAIPRRGDQEQRLIQAILDRPEDDAPRLAYADWLRGRGNSQGEFVRLWCQLERHAGDGDGPAVVEQRWTDLLERDGEKWLAPLAALGLRPEICGQFYPSLWLFPRGLIEEIEIDKPGILPEQAEQLFAAAPVLHRLILTYDRIDMTALAATPQLARITSLELPSVNLAIKDLRALLASPNLGRLRELDISFSEFGPKGGRMLAASALLPQLRILKLAACHFRAPGVQALATAPFGELVHLDLAKNACGPKGVQALASAALGRLELLNLTDNQIGTDGVRALRDAPFLGSLTALVLKECDLGPDAAAVLAELSLPRLTRLDLSDNPLTAEGVRALAVTRQ